MQEKLLEAIIALRSDFAAAAAERKNSQLDSSTVVSAAERVRSRASAIHGVPRRITAADVASSSPTAGLVPVLPPPMQEQSIASNISGRAFQSPGLKQRSSSGGGQLPTSAGAASHHAAAQRKKTLAVNMEDWPDSSQMIDTVRRFRSETGPSPSAASGTSTPAGGGGGTLRTQHRIDPVGSPKVAHASPAATNTAGGSALTKPSHFGC